MIKSSRSILIGKMVTLFWTCSNCNNESAAMYWYNGSFCSGACKCPNCKQ